MGCLPERAEQEHQAGSSPLQTAHLELEGRLTLELCDGTESLDERLEEGFRIEGSGWKEAEGTSINAHPATRRFYTQAAQRAAEGGFLRVVFLRLDGRPIAFKYCFELNRTLYSMKTGYDLAYARFSPGGKRRAARSSNI